MYAPLFFFANLVQTELVPLSEEQQVKKAISDSLEDQSWEVSMERDPEFSYLERELKATLPELAIKHVAGIGACFYESVCWCIRVMSDADQITFLTVGKRVIGNSGHELRGRTVDHMRATVQPYIYFVSGCSWTDFLENAARSSTDADNIVIQACADMLNVNIYIHGLDTNNAMYQNHTIHNNNNTFPTTVPLITSQITCKKKSVTTIHLAHHFPASCYKSHYTPLLPENQVTTKTHNKETIGKYTK